MSTGWPCRSCVTRLQVCKSGRKLGDTWSKGYDSENLAKNVSTRYKRPWRKKSAGARRTITNLRQDIALLYFELGFRDFNVVIRQPRPELMVTLGVGLLRSPQVG
jgi:hypothetical protein